MVNSEFNCGWGFDFCWSDPRFIVGQIFDIRFITDDMTGYSEDGGVTWKRFPAVEAGTLPTNMSFIGGDAWVNGRNKDNIILKSGKDDRFHYSLDRGATWGTASTIKGTVRSDPVNGNWYCYHGGGGGDPSRLWTSTDGGAAWTLTSEDFAWQYVCAAHGRFVRMRRPRRSLPQPPLPRPRHPCAHSAPPASKRHYGATPLASPEYGASPAP